MEDSNAMLSFRIDIPEEISDENKMTTLYLRTKRQKLIQAMRQKRVPPSSCEVYAPDICQFHPEMSPAANVQSIEKEVPGTPTLK